MEVGATAAGEAVRDWLQSCWDALPTAPLETVLHEDTLPIVQEWMRRTERAAMMTR